jgi:hypothetical protein
MMTTTHDSACTGAPKRKKLAVRTVFAGGLAIAVIGLPAAMANADPAPPNTPSPTPTITATLHPPAPPAPHGGGSESGLCNRDSMPRDAPPPLNC